MDAAGPDHHEQPSPGVGAFDDVGGCIATGEDCCAALLDLWDLVLEEVRWGDGRDAADAPVFEVRAVTVRGAGCVVLGKLFVRSCWA